MNESAFAFVMEMSEKVMPLQGVALLQSRSTAGRVGVPVPVKPLYVMSEISRVPVSASLAEPQNTDISIQSAMVLASAKRTIVTLKMNAQMG